MTSTQARVPYLTDYWCVKGDPEQRRFPTTQYDDIKAVVREVYPTDDAIKTALGYTYGELETNFYRLYAYTPEYRPVREVIADLNAALKGLCLEPDEYGWNVSEELKDAYDYRKSGYTGEPHLWPADQYWISCYAVTGGNEGHYMHLEVIHKGGSRTMIALAKTFQGMEFAYDVCKATAMILEA